MNTLFKARPSLPMIFQSETSECGLACLTMVANYFGNKFDLRSLRSMVNISGGASVKQLLDAAKSLGMRGRALRLEPEDLDRLSLPAILHWDLDHFVVLKKLKRGVVVIHDPASGIQNYTRKELGKHLSGVAVELLPSTLHRESQSKRAYALSQLVAGTNYFGVAIWQIFVMSALIQLFAVLTPLYMQLVIDQGLVKGDKDLILFLASLFSILVVVKTLVVYMRGIVLLQFSNRMDFQVFSNVFAHLLHLPLSYFSRREMGDIVSRFSSLDKVKNLLTQEVITVLVDGIFSLLTLLLLFLYEPWLALIILFTVVLSCTVRVVCIPFERARRQELIVNGAKQQSRFMENIRSISVCKTYGIERQRLHSWQELYIGYINSGFQLGKLQLGLNSFQTLVIGLENIVVVYCGALLIYSGQFSIGQLISFIFLKQHFVSSLNAMLPKLAEIKLMGLELERVSDITLERQENQSPANVLMQTELGGEIELSKLSFAYPQHRNSEKQLLLQGIDCVVKPGMILGISGPSGSGKSSLLSLILGMEKPSEGKILFDGHSIARLGLTILRSQVASVLHGDALLAGDLAYNIHLDTDSGHPKKMIECCELVEIHEVICGLPLAYRTPVGEMGIGLSAGQVQRVLLARALYRDPKILVLDEALSHLDDSLALRLLHKIRERNITVVLVSHNTRLLQLAERHIFLGPTTCV